MNLQTDPKLKIFEKISSQPKATSTTVCKAPELIGASLNEHVFFEIDGDDLAPEFRKGDVIVCRELSRDLWQNKLPFDESDFVVSHPSIGATLKQIISHDTEAGLIVCRSLGRDRSDITLNLDEITNLYFVIEHRIPGKNKRKLNNSKIECVKQQPICLGTQKNQGEEFIAFEIRGDSMNDGLEHSLIENDKVLVKELAPVSWHSKLKVPEIFIIVHKNDGILCREIINHDVENGIITCHSFNPEHRDFELNLNDVAQLFYIKETFRTH